LVWTDAKALRFGHGETADTAAILAEQLELSLKDPRVNGDILPSNP
jgi:hypothetical protein